MKNKSTKGMKGNRAEQLWNDGSINATPRALLLNEAKITDDSEHWEELLNLDWKNLPKEVRESLNERYGNRESKSRYKNTFDPETNTFEILQYSVIDTDNGINLMQSNNKKELERLAEGLTDTCKCEIVENMDVGKRIKNGDGIPHFPTQKQLDLDSVKHVKRF